jgi:hypothetical protein
MACQAESSLMRDGPAGPFSITSPSTSFAFSRHCRLLAGATLPITTYQETLP